MNKIQLILTVIAVLAIACFVWSSRTHWRQSPHEFAYGASLANLQELPRVVFQFLSLPALDPAKIRVEASILDGSYERSIRAYGAQDISSLASYLNGKVGSRPGGPSLVSELRHINTISDPFQKTDALLKTLIHHKDLIRDEPNQENVIIFIFYDLKNPSLLDPDIKKAISLMTQRLDTDQEAQLFDGRRCPKSFLEGNINIYPLAMENTGWYKSLGLPGDPIRPILEIRFMGLRGIFRYLLDSMERSSGLSFIHLDGETLP